MASEQHPKKHPPSLPRAALRDALACNWSQFHPIAALYCLPAIIAVLIAGQLSDHPLEGLIAAAGALPVGFGAFQHLTRLRAAPMLLAAAGISLSAAIGTMVSGIPVVEAATAGLWGFALGLFTALGTASWWVLLQCAVALVIATTFPADLLHAGERAGLVLAGGAVQIAAITALWLLFPGPFTIAAPPNEQPPPRTLREAWQTLGRTAALHSDRLWYCVSLGASVAAGVGVFRLSGMENGYWTPMTVLLVLRWGGLQVTLARAFARGLGTLAGALLVTLFAAVIQPPPGVLIGLGILAAWVAYAFQWVNYGALSLGVTAYVVLGFAVAGLPEPVIAAHRALATLLGAALAVVGQLVLHTLERMSRG
ncbi:MAG TPA: FUSC family protein [Acetobacteraceae bacterium]|nr:FUSC family protein [Acetobacteraceae bacterium]